MMFWTRVWFAGVLYPLLGYEVTWRVHFVAMVGMLGFVVACLALASPATAAASALPPIKALRRVITLKRFVFAESGGAGGLASGDCR